MIERSSSARATKEDMRYAPPSGILCAVQKEFEINYFKN